MFALNFRLQVEQVNSKDNDPDVDTLALALCLFAFSFTFTDFVLLHTDMFDDFRQ